MKKYLLVLLFCVFCLQNIFAELEYYRNHFIVVVDQGQIQSHQNTIKLYSDLCRFFTTTDKEQRMSHELNSQSKCTGNITFSPQTDQLTLFYSGVSRAEFATMHNICASGTISTDIVNNKIVESLIHKSADFQLCNAANPIIVEAFLEKYLRPYMDASSQLHSDVHIGLNEFIYPLVLSKINDSIPAEHYYILVVSNFNSQGQAQQVHQTQLEPFLAYIQNPKYVRAFDAFKKNLEDPFYRVENILLVRDANGQYITNNSNNNPQVKGAELCLACLQNSCINVEMPLQFKQKEYNGTEFDLSTSMVNFNRDDRVKINQIKLILQESQSENPIEIVLANDSFEVKKYEKTSSKFEFPKFAQELGNVQLNDTIKVEYLFLGNVSTGHSKMPLAFRCSSVSPIGEDSLVPAPTTTEKLITYAVIILLIIGLVAYAVWLYFKRINKHSATVDFEIEPISSSRYMNVKDNKVDNYDCWYIKEGKHQRSITVSGTLHKKPAKFAAGCLYRLEYWAEDADDDDRFTFKPEGELKGIGTEKVLKQWYGVDVDKTGKFSFDIISYVDFKKHEEFYDKMNYDHMLQEHHQLELKIKLRIVLLRKSYKDEYSKEVLTNIDCERAIKIIENDNNLVARYKYVVKPDFSRKDAWIAFDPGTSGSCAAVSFDGDQSAQNNIITVKNKEGHLGSDDTYTSIFPSKVMITDRSRVFSSPGQYTKDGFVCNVERFMEGPNNDFAFGNYPDNHINLNTFQSIKKLLGYTTPLQIVKNDRKYSILGRDLAHLLVKGLYSQVENYIMSDKTVDEHLKAFYSENGRFDPQRAIVAVPNNYSMTKVQEMVDSVKRLQKFKEVHYVYESEGVFMTFCHKEFSHLNDLKDKLFLVFDMGGATINATVFTFNVEKMDDGNNKLINVNTISKIGYCVGGDDIDYAIIKALYVFSSFKKEENVRESMRLNKQALIKMATDVKIDLINRVRGRQHQFASDEDLYTYVQTRFMELSINFKGINVETTETDDTQKRNKKITDLVSLFRKELDKNLEEYVYSKVRDSIHEVVGSIKANRRDMLVIYSGRSTLYPHIMESVKQELEKCHYRYERWHGFDDPDGYLDADRVKTAVVEGACWYARFSNIVRLKHDVITSSFGYINVVQNTDQFVPLVERNDHFENGEKKGSSVPSSVLSQVRFVQMLGSDYQQILNDYDNNGIKHKMNVLDVVLSESIDGRIKDITITIDDANNFKYEIKTASDPVTPATNPYSRMTGNNDVKVEIADENNESYIYSTLRCVDEHVSVNYSSDTRQTKSNSSTRRL